MKNTPNRFAVAANRRHATQLAEAQRRGQPSSEMFEPTRALSPMVKATLTGKPFQYRVAQITDEGVWTSAAIFTGDATQMMQNVVGGFLMGRARWAEDLDGLILGGLDARGNRLWTEPHAGGNLATLRAWTRENVGAYTS